jgi:hypothetical protein
LATFFASNRAVEALMRERYITVIVAIGILAVGAKLILLPPKNAGAISSSVGLDIQQVQEDKNVQQIPAQEMIDMSLVFDRNK